MSVLRFLALTGEADRLKAWLEAFVPPRDPPIRLNRVFDAPDLAIFAPPESPLVPLADEHGLVLGQLFAGVDPAVPVARLDETASRGAASSLGQSLIERRWGRFAAFVRKGGAVAAMRDPSGTVPVHFADLSGLHLYFSDLELALAAGYRPPGLDDAFLRQWLTYPYLRTARTGIEGCSELLPGTVRVTSAAGQRLETLWSPWRAADPAGEILDFEDAARRLRAVALGTVPAQFAGVELPLLELSGGLDSSIVAACLKAGGINFKAATFATRTPAGDERDYARVLAERLAIDLIEEGEDALPLDLSPPSRSLRPPLSPVLQPLERAFSRAARESGSRDLVTGAGGDNIFCYLTSAAPAVDAFGRLPLGAVLGALQDVAALGDCTIWKAGRYALLKQLRRRRRPAWRRDLRFLAPEAIAAAPDPHPWLAAPAGAAAGRLEHVEALVRIQYFLQPEHASGEAMHHPLLNQPLVETCLAIPSWLWVRGGRNRAVARAAFADLLPPRIVNRRTKGSLAAMCSRAFTASAPRICDLLLGGELAGRGLIDRAAVEARLRAADTVRDEDYFRIFDLVSLELWLRSWRC
jgi:asparagine synthase (glutamine-hydrolysing)